MLVPAIPGRAEEQDVVLKACGILYPKGYDPNTVGEVQGKVQGLTRPMNGPVSFQLVAGRERYIVLASPAWYWRSTAAEFTPGLEVVVRGSKSLGTDNNLYIIAQEIRIIATGKVLTFRTAAGVPLWSGQAGRAGYRGGSGSMMRGGSGMGGGMHGRNR
ncbi:MAG: hypothetical protein ABFD81_13020 [Syntrophaceae bacterium]